MKIVLAPDSFKGSLTALRAAQILRDAALFHFPGAQTLLCPIADGGEGTLDAMVTAKSGAYFTETVKNPLGAPIDARWGLIDRDTAVVELAQASGLPLLSPDARDPLNASSYGTGELMRAALGRGAKKLLIGIGGSATNDGGMGLLCALGARFYDEAGSALTPCGAALERVARVDLTGLMPEAIAADIAVLCDVTNPLLGERGATAVYGAQKGVTDATRPLLERGMENYAAHLRKATGRDIANAPGAGAAGGVGAALSGVLGARMLSGIDAVLDAVGIDEMLDGATLCVTGEGRIDEQSVLYNKAPVGVARRCAARGIPVLLLVGGIGGDVRGLYDIADASIQSIVNAPMAVEEAMARAEALAKDAADRLFRTLKIGTRLRDV